LIFFFIGLFVGFNIGNWSGKISGRKETEHKAPLIILRKSLKKGYCIICGRKNSSSGRNLENNIELNNNKKENRGEY
jgi:hypothetical protein